MPPLRGNILAADSLDEIADALAKRVPRGAVELEIDENTQIELGGATIMTYGASKRKHLPERPHEKESTNKRNRLSFFLR